MVLGYAASTSTVLDLNHVLSTGDVRETKKLKQREAQECLTLLCENRGSFSLHFLIFFPARKTSRDNLLLPSKTTAKKTNYKDFKETSSELFPNTKSRAPRSRFNKLNSIMTLLIPKWSIKQQQ